jgi:SAM-dependent methyltransferase
VPNEIIAIDPSGEQLAYGCARPGARLAQFRQGDAAKLPFPDDSFDSATMALVISFLSDPTLAVAEMARVVRPGGWVSTYMWDIPGGGAPTAPIELAMKSLGLTRGAPPDSAVSRRESLFGLWEKAGLVSISTRVINVPITYSNFEDFWDTNNVRIGPVGKMIDEMPPDLRERLRARLRQHLPADSSGRICYEARANAVKGKVPL